MLLVTVRNSGLNSDGDRNELARTLLDKCEHAASRHLPSKDTSVVVAHIEATNFSELVVVVESADHIIDREVSDVLNRAVRAGIRKYYTAETGSVPLVLIRVRPSNTHEGFIFHE